MTGTNSIGIAAALKATTFLVGLALLLAGAVWLDYPDWDIGICFVMALTTLATAEWSTQALWLGRWQWMPLAIFWTWLSVDGVYWAYWSIVKPEVMIREGQWLASLCLYALCGIIWYRLVPMIAEWIEQMTTREGA
jgi:hypothetical protein